MSSWWSIQTCIVKDVDEVVGRLEPVPWPYPSVPPVFRWFGSLLDCVHEVLVPVWPQNPAEVVSAAHVDAAAVDPPDGFICTVTEW